MSENEKPVNENAEKTISELFEELKKDLAFLPNDEAKERFLFAFKHTLIS